MNLVDALYQPTSLTCRWVLRSHDRDGIARVVTSCFELLRATFDADAEMQASETLETRPIAVWRARRPGLRALTDKSVSAIVAEIRSGGAHAVDAAVPSPVEDGPFVSLVWDEVGDYVDDLDSVVLATDLARFANEEATRTWVDHFRAVADEVEVVTGYMTAGISSEATAFNSPYEDAVGSGADAQGLGEQWKTMGGAMRGAFWGNLVSDVDMRHIESAAGSSSPPGNRPFLVERRRHAWYVQLRSDPTVVEEQDLRALQSWLEPALIGAGIPYDADPRVGVVLPRQVDGAVGGGEPRDA